MQITDLFASETAGLPARILALDEKTRTVKHVISTGTLDRGNRMVDPGGWRLEKFKANPVVMLDHTYDVQNVIGKAIDVHVEQDALVAVTEFASEGLGDVAFRMVQAGYVRAWSVGWIGLESHSIGTLKGCQQCKAVADQVETGRHFTAQELLEYSLVAIPSNPDIVMGLQAAGVKLPSRLLRRWDQTVTRPANLASAMTRQSGVSRSPTYTGTRAPEPRRKDEPLRFFEGIGDQLRFRTACAVESARLAMEKPAAFDRFEHRSNEFRSALSRTRDSFRMRLIEIRAR